MAALTVSRILHAGYVFACGGTRIAFDTIFENPFSRNCHAFPDVRFDAARIRRQRFDAVFISHFHDDHCSLESLDLLDRATPLYIYCLFDELFDMVRQLGFTNVHALRLDEPVHVGPFEVVPREAMDADVDSMFQIRAAGLNVLNVVDSWIDDATAARLVAEKPWDLVLWPFQTMREIEVLAPSRHAPAPPALPEDALAQLQALAPRYVVPSSCQLVFEPWSLRGNSTAGSHAGYGYPRSRWIGEKTGSARAHAARTRHCWRNSRAGTPSWATCSSFPGTAFSSARTLQRRH